MGEGECYLGKRADGEVEVEDEVVVMGEVGEGECKESRGEKVWKGRFERLN